MRRLPMPRKANLIPVHNTRDQQRRRGIGIQGLCQFLAVSVVATCFLCKPAHADEDSLMSGFGLGGYSSATVNSHPGGHVDASLNELSLFLKWEGDSRFRFFSELEIEKPLVRSRKGNISTQDAFFDVERLYFDYNLSEKINLRAGRFLTPAGRWNLIHAAPLQWTASRPLVTSRLFAESVSGVMLYGAQPFADQALEYTVYMEAMQDSDRGKDDRIPYQDTKGLRLQLTGKVKLGFSLLETVEDLDVKTRYRMAGVDFFIEHHGWEYSGEFLERTYTNGHDGGGGAYLQGVAPLGNRWFGIARVETFNRPAEGSSERWVLGTAWRMTPGQVLKMEYVGGDKERVESPKGFLASFAILF